MRSLAAHPDVERFTRIPAGADDAFVTAWIGRYEEGWKDGSGAGFAIVDSAGGLLLGFSVLPEARGRGVAARPLSLLVRWWLDTLALERLELRIDPGPRTDVGVWSRLGKD